ncbi:outer membrane transport energization protein TonB (plasmid) [Phaeobacter porticola]|uniref:Outer membrane transport energization protein TonB n=2 Tax=Phaeobacter porticola TaxID=1844006 RepID=A0A1L3IAF2_9RHOB|nr:outer membrane transport energization protein TonB [Phaeobacter porticola]
MAAAGTSFADLAVGLVPAKSSDSLIRSVDATHLAPSKPVVRQPVKPSPKTQQVARSAPTVVPAEPRLAKAVVPINRPSQTVEAAPRPKAARPRPLKPTPEQKQSPAREATQPEVRGNSDQASTKGRAEGRAEPAGGRALRQTGQAKQQGNAAADNYRGQVLRRIQRAKRQRVNIRGTAVVRFAISASGSIASVTISASSGSAKLDAIALAQVRRAGPFPPPPAGARTRYTVKIKGK